VFSLPETWPFGQGLPSEAAAAEWKGLIFELNPKDLSLRSYFAVDGLFFFFFERFGRDVGSERSQRGKRKEVEEEEAKEAKEVKEVRRERNHVFTSWRTRSTWRRRTRTRRKNGTNGLRRKTQRQTWLWLRK
jgi:hypothetical protein